MSAIEKDFRALPIEARRLTGPLLWLHGGEGKERLEVYVDKITEGGNGSFTVESRPHSDWLGEGWFRDVRTCLEAGKKNGLKVWIFDERMYPSFEVAGKVPREFSSRFLVATATNMSGPHACREAGYGGPQFVAALAGKMTPDGIDGGSLVDLAGFTEDGVLKWNVPDGRWAIMKFTWKYIADSEGRKVLVDGTRQESVDWLIRTVYQPHHDRFKGDFGKDIAGFFFDEPFSEGDWGPEVGRILAERKIDWRKAFVAQKFRLAGGEQAAMQYAYCDALAEAWGRTLYGGLAGWCHERGVLSVGHFIEHGQLYLEPRVCAGNVFQLMKYADMGGVDMVGNQLGLSRTRHPGVYQVPKLASSVSHVYNKTDDIAMCEIFGACGQGTTYPEMKWSVDQHQVRGVNFMVPHSFNPRAPYDTDYAPFFYNGGYEPRWPLYRVWADYTSRLSLMLSGGRHVCPVAFLFLGHSKHVGKALFPEDMTTSLQDALYDCDWMPYEVFENDARVSGGRINLHREQYQVLVVPPVEVIPCGTLEKAEQFFAEGGVVIGYGFLPSRPATPGRTPADIAALCAKIWGDGPRAGISACRTNAAGGRSYFLPEQPAPAQITQVLLRDAGVPPLLEVLEGDTGSWLHVLHRVKSDCDVFLVCNQHLDGPPRTFKFRARAEGFPECWDAMRNEITAVQHRRDGKAVEFELTLEPIESVLLVFQKKERELPSYRRKNQPQPLAVLTVTADPKARVVPDPELPADRKDVTRSPVKSSVFQGICDVPATVDISKSRIHLEAGDLAPEGAASITVNGKYAGGFIGKPYRLEVTSLLRPGENSILIVPFAPKSVRLVVTAAF
jgi:hypothetical protein